MIYLSPGFWADAAERALKTVAQTLLALWGIADGVFDILSVNAKQAFSVALGAAVLSLLMSIASASVGDSGTASLVVDPPSPPVNEDGR